MKRKVKRFKEGGYESTDDYKNLMAAQDRETAEASAPKTTNAGEPLKMASFGEAFKEARGRGDKTFEYMGKKYTTETAGAKKPAVSETKPSASSTTSKPSTTYADAAKSSRTLGDVIKSDASEQAEFRKRVAEGKDKTLGTRLQEGFRKFGRALSTGRPQGESMKKGGSVKASSASKRADGIAQRGKTRGRMV